MSSPAYANALVIEPDRSRGLAVVAVGGYAAAVLALWWLPPLVAVIALIALAVALPREWSRLSAPGRRLEWHATGHWYVSAADGSLYRAGLAPGSVCNRWFAILVLDTGQGLQRRLIARDAVAPVVWRRLRVRLRTEGPGATGMDARGGNAGV